MINNDSIIKLITYIVCYATEHDSRLTTLRLVKFIYLADLYYARQNSGQSFTNFPWAFVYYGPYCSEAMEYIDKAVSAGAIIRSKYQSGYEDAKDYALFTCHVSDISSVGKQLPMAILPDLQVAIKKYGDETPSLLDYVYFDTEPMVAVRKGDLLDFTKAKKPAIIQARQSIKIPKADIEKAKQHLKLLAEKYKKGRQNLVGDERESDRWKDELYYTTLNRLNEEPLPEGLAGTVKISY